MLISSSFNNVEASAIEPNTLYDVYLRVYKSQIKQGATQELCEIMGKETTEVEALLVDDNTFCVKERVDNDTLADILTRLKAEGCTLVTKINNLGNNKEWILTIEALAGNKIESIKAIKTALGCSLTEAKAITDDLDSIIIKTTDGEKVLKVKEIIEASGTTVNLIYPKDVCVFTKGALVLRSAPNNQVTYDLIVKDFGKTQAEAQAFFKDIPYVYLSDNIVETEAQKLIEEFSDINAELEFIEAFQLNLTNFGGNETEILKLILEANYFDAEDSESLAQIENLTTVLPSLILSSGDYDKILELKDAIEEAGGEAEIGNICYITVEKDDEGKIISFPEVVMKGMHIDICFQSGFGIYMVNKLYINGERITDDVRFNNRVGEICYTINTAQEDYSIKVEQKEELEFNGLDDSLEFVYSGKPHDLRKFIIISNPNVTLDDCSFEYEEEILLPNGEYDWKIYKEDDPPIEAGFYSFYGGYDCGFDKDYYGDLYYYFTIQKKDLIVKPKDISITENNDFDFETEYVGLVHGDEVLPNEDFEYVIYAEDDMTSKSPTPIPKEEAIKNPGRYVISYVNDKDSLFDENKNYNITIENAILTVKKKTSSTATPSNSTPYYYITVIENPNATVQPNGDVKVKRGSEQKFSFEAEEGYEISAILVDGKDYGVMPEYTFKNVKSKHTVEVVVKEKNSTNEDKLYNDVDEDDWFYETVKNVTEKGLMEGTGNKEFSPYIGTTRGMIVTILHRLEGKPKATIENTFTDVKDGMWYTDAIAFGEENGIILGYGDGRFGPNDIITREQLSAIMYRYAKYKGYDVSTNEDNMSKYNDANNVSDYAVEPMKWAINNGLINGMENNTLNPRQNATRAQVATILTRFYERYIK